MFKRLYVIGNGFDLHHNVKSNYKDYLRWLKKNKFPTYEKINDFFDTEEDRDQWWSDFEQNLGYPYDIRGKVEEYGFRNQPTDDDLEKIRTIETYAGAWDAQDEIGGLIEEIKSTFHNWVDSLGEADENETIQMDTEESYFINFNYTLTLENLYGIPSERVLHIHGCLNDDEYVIGHGRSYEDILDEAEPAVEPWDGKTDPSEYGIDAYDDEITENAKKEVVNQVFSLRKPVDDIIKWNQRVFDSLSYVEEVYIYGMSFSSVDEEYLNKIIMTVRKDAKYTISFYSDGDKEKIDKFMTSKNIKYNLIKLVDVRKYTLF